LTTHYDILGIGRCAVDDLLYVDAYPPADAKVRITRRDRQPGGLTGTALVAAARLGSRCAYAGTVGTDFESEFVLQSLEAETVDTANAARLDGARPNRSEIIVDETARTRTVFSDPYLGEGVPVPDDLVRRARVLFVDHADAVLMLHPTRVAREAGIPVVADLEKDKDPGVLDLMRRVDHLVVTFAFAKRVTGETDPAAAAAALWDDTKSAVVVTWGAQGSWSLDHAGAPAIHTPAFPVDVVDTTGCGDIFHGAYAHALARGLDLTARVRLAAAAAAIKATRPGGQKGAPTAVELDAFLSHPGV
jgi:sulfofructose kinase